MVDIRHFQDWSYLQSVKHCRHLTFRLIKMISSRGSCLKWGLKLIAGAVCGDWHDICFGSLSTRPKLSEHLWITLMASQLWRWKWGLKLCAVGGSSVGGGWSLLWPRGECRHSYTFSFPPPPLCSHSSNTFKILFYIFLFLLIKIGLYLSTHIRYLDYLDPGSPIHKLLHCAFIIISTAEQRCLQRSHPIHLLSI